MALTLYRFKFYLNAIHSLEIGNIHSNIHPHTWEIVLYISKNNHHDFIQFSEMEKDVQAYLAQYEEKLLNEIPPFDKIAPTMEHIGEILFLQLTEMMNSKGWTLQKLEISESPTRTYIILNDGNYEFEYQVDLEGSLNRSWESTTSGMTDKSRSAGDEREGGKGEQEPELPAEECRFNQRTEKADMEALKTLTCIEQDVKKENHFKKNLIRKAVRLCLYILWLAITSAVFYVLLIRTGYYPWAEDTWGHMFKTHFLYDQVMAGNYFPLYMEYWYNGVQPFRYWAPLPYYIMLLFEMITKGNSILAYNLFVVFIFSAGTFGWILWGMKLNHMKIALLFGVLWFFMPDNLRVLFVEGNLPRVVVTTLLPYLMLGVWEYLENRSKRSFVVIAAGMFLCTLSHLMIAAMVGITLFIFVMIDGFVHKRMKNAIEVLCIAVLGIVSTGIWLYPALQGGLLSLDPEAVAEVMENLTYPALQSINPLLRLRNKEVFYFGISAFFISLVGILFGDRKSKPYFWVVLIIFFGTTKSFVPILSRLPFSQLFWMMRFGPMALVCFLTGLLLWQNVRKVVYLFMCLFIIWDCSISYNVVFHNASEPTELMDAVSTGIQTAEQRIAMLDLSKYGSFPSYYLTYNPLSHKKLSQVYGWAWQGAKTASNIMWINSALEGEYYPFMFDRCVELGADTLIVKKDQVKDWASFFEAAEKIGYKVIDESTMVLTLKLPIDESFATKVRYEGLAIGKYAPNIAYMFPAYEVGTSFYIEDYHLSELLQYKVIYLSGFRYKDMEKAENMIKELSENGVKVLIDLTGVQESVFSSRQEFLGVIAQPVKFYNNFGKLKLFDEYITVGDIPEEYEEWNTFFLVNLDKVYGETEFNRQYLDFLGSKYNDNIIFIGFNLPFYALNTKDAKAVEMFEQITGIRYNEPPQRDLIPIKVDRAGNVMTVETEEENVLTGIAYLDAFIPVTGEFEERHSLIHMKDKKIVYKVGYPYLIQGVITSAIGVLGMILAYYFLYTRKKEI